MAFAIFRSIFAIVTITKHTERESLPFINPVLWFDWVAVWSFCGFFPGSLAETTTLMAAAVGVAVYAISLWLCIGYAFLGYGTRQYDVIDTTSLCASSITSYQTDPRRMPFLVLHELYFILATSGFLLLAYYISNLGAARRTNVLIDTSIICVMVLPPIAGIALATVLHFMPYLLLMRNGCYGSYVSGSLVYLDRTVSWAIKVATILGINI